MLSDKFKRIYDKPIGLCNNGKTAVFEPHRCSRSHTRYDETVNLFRVRAHARIFTSSNCHNFSKTTGERNLLMGGVCSHDTYKDHNIWKIKTFRNIKMFKTSIRIRKSRGIRP